MKMRRLMGRVLFFIDILYQIRGYDKRDDDNSSYISLIKK